MTQISETLRLMMIVWIMAIAPEGRGEGTKTLATENDAGPCTLINGVWICF
jgi:hypothetical protein